MNTDQHSQTAATWLQRVWAVLSRPLGKPKQEETAPLPVRLPENFQANRHKRLSLGQLGVDQWFICCALFLLLWGVVMVYSASIAIPDHPRFANLSNTHFLKNHVFALSLGTALALTSFLIPIRFWKKTAPVLFIFSLVLLVLVLIPGIGKEVNGSRRWINLVFLNFQPSEFTKLIMALYASDYICRKMEAHERNRAPSDAMRFIKTVTPMVVAVAIVGLLLLLETDLGAFMVVSVIALGILFLGGVNARMWFLISLVLIIAVALFITFSPLRRERIFAFLDPWNTKYALGRGYQLTHALIAMSLGKWFGVGLGGSIEKMQWLPEVHTDFLLALIGEELGFVGVCVAIWAFFWLTRRMIEIGRQAILLEQVFAGLTAQGIGIWFGFQAFIHIGVNVGALPTKGLTLPLMSYGGSALLMNMMALAIVLRVDYENRMLMKRGSL